MSTPIVTTEVKPVDSGIISTETKKKKIITAIGTNGIAIALIIIGIIMLGVGMWLISDEQTDSGYPVAIVGVLTGGLGAFMMYKSAKKTIIE